MSSLSDISGFSTLKKINDAVSTLWGCSEEQKTAGCIEVVCCCCSTDNEGEAVRLKGFKTCPATVKCQDRGLGLPVFEPTH